MNILKEYVRSVISELKKDPEMAKLKKKVLDDPYKKRTGHEFTLGHWLFGINSNDNEYDDNHLAYNDEFTEKWAIQVLHKWVRFERNKGRHFTKAYLNDVRQFVAQFAHNADIKSVDDEFDASKMLFSQLGKRYQQ